MTNQPLTEPPVLYSSDGEQIVIHRNADGSFFSNHPEYGIRLALHNDAQAREAADQAKADAQAEAEIDDESGPSPDNGDSEVDYEEMVAKDLAALARSRHITIPSGSKRHDVIDLLRAWDEAHSA